MNEVLKPQYAYSFDGERYFGKLDTREETEAEALSESESDEYTIAYIAEILTAEQIIQKDRESLGWRLANCLFDFLEDELFEIISADSTIIEVTEEDGKKAEEKIVDAILEHWTFNHYTIKEETIEEINLTKNAEAEL